MVSTNVNHVLFYFIVINAVYFSLAMRIIAEHKLIIMGQKDVTAYGNVREFGNLIFLSQDHILEDFEYAMDTPVFFRCMRLPIVVEMTDSSGNRTETADYGGPNMAAITTMLDKFVFHDYNNYLVREKWLIQCTGDWEKDLRKEG